MASLPLYSIKRLKAAAPIPTERKADFVPMGGGSQAVLQMDPRMILEGESRDSNPSEAGNAN
ncbi:MAG: hypothetical protein WEK74_15760 [Hydrogenophaga sp.]